MSAGPNVTPGYFNSDELTAAVFNDDGYYRSGDAVVLADPANPAAGLVFRGRIAEDFKLATGTFVRVGALRTALLSCAPLLLDAVITGRGSVGALAWLNLTQANKLLGREPQPQASSSLTLTCVRHWPLRWLVTMTARVSGADRAAAGHGSAARLGRRGDHR